MLCLFYKMFSERLRASQITGKEKLTLLAWLPYGDYTALEGAFGFSSYKFGFLVTTAWLMEKITQQNMLKVRVSIS